VLKPHRDPLPTHTPAVPQAPAPCIAETQPLIFNCTQQHKAPHEGRGATDTHKVCTQKERKQLHTHGTSTHTWYVAQTLVLRTQEHCTS
jgi:hypothetical protein